MADPRHKPFSDAVARFVRDTKATGQVVVAWPLSDTSFRINSIEQEGDYARLFGQDAEGRDSMIVLPANQLAIQMIAEDPDTDDVHFGFFKLSGEVT